MVCLCCSHLVCKFNCLTVVTVAPTAIPNAIESCKDVFRAGTIDARGRSGAKVEIAVRIRPRPQAFAIERGSTRSGCCCGFWLLSCLPVPRKKVDNFVGRMIRQPGQHVGEPGLRINVVHLAGLDQGIDGGGTIAASV